MTATVPSELIEFEKARLIAEARRENAEAEKLEHEARQEKVRADLQTLASSYEEYLHKYNLAGDDYNHVYNFTGAVNAASVKACMQVLGKWSRLEPACDIEIVFNSPGGSVIDGMALWDFLTHLRTSGHKLTTVCRGMAASMGGILLQAGDVRVMGRESYMLIHEVSSGAGGKLAEIEDEVAFLRKISGRMVRILAERSTLTVKQIETKWKKTDWWLASDECLELGFVDQVR